MAVNFAQTLVFVAVFGGLSLGIDHGANHFLTSNSVQAMETSNPAPAKLQGTTWYISSWTETMALGTDPVRLQFNGDRLSGTAGCNNFNGSYQAHDGSLTIGEALGTTRKMCVEEIMAQEGLFLKLLPQVRSYGFSTDGQLELIYSKNGKEGKITFIPESQFTPLHNSQWQLVSLGGVVPIAGEDSERMPNLKFIGDRLGGTGGCNRLMGQFSLDGDRLTINGQMASTMMACSEPLMEQEQMFVNALTTAKKYQILPTGELVIDYGENGKTKQLVFKPLMKSQARAEESKTKGQTQGVEKTIFVAPSQTDCTGVGPQTCLQIKEGHPNQAWKLHYFPIQGFTYEPGYYYRLKVLETVVPNPPADGSSLIWTLIAVESKSPR